MTRLVMWPDHIVTEHDDEGDLIGAWQMEPEPTLLEWLGARLAIAASCLLVATIGYGIAWAVTQ